MPERFPLNFRRNIAYNISERLYIIPTKTFKVGLIAMTTSTNMGKLEECFNRKKAETAKAQNKFPRELGSLGLDGI